MIDIVVSTVIVNWNTKRLLQECLASVYETAGALDLEVILVDNASSDGSVDMVRKLYPQVRLVQNSENVGFARANNQAISLCRGHYVLLLNSDTLVQPGALQKLLQFMEAHPEAGVVGPKVLHPQGRLRTLSAGYRTEIRTAFNHFFFLSRLFPNHPSFRGLHLLVGLHDKVPMRVDWISGAALLVRRRVIEQVGLLDERWFMYAEDKQWCDRIGAAGWALYHVPEAVVLHHFGASSRQGGPTSKIWVQSQHNYFSLRPDSSRLRVLAFDVVITLGLLFRAVIYCGLGLLGRQRSMWWDEAGRFSCYAKESLRLAVRTLRGAQ